MKILFTGGLGFIGSHTAVEVLNAGHDVVIVDDLSNSKIGVLDKIKQITGKDVKFYQNDVCDKAALENIFEENKDILETIARENKKVISWSSRVYITYDKDLIKYPEQLEDTGIYYDTNLSAPKKIDLIKGLFDEYDIDYSDLIYSAKSSKKSNDKVEE